MLYIKNNISCLYFLLELIGIHIWDYKSIISSLYYIRLVLIHLVNKARLNKLTGSVNQPGVESTYESEMLL